MDVPHEFNPAEIGDAQRRDAEAFQDIPDVVDPREEFYILSHGKLSERVRKQALEVLIICQPMPIL